MSDTLREMARRGRPDAGSPKSRSAPRRVKSFMLRNIPAALHTRFKAACARRGRTMEEVLLEFMRIYGGGRGK